MISLLIPSISGPSLPFPCLLYFLSSLCLASFFIRTNHHCTIIVNLYSHFATASVCVCVCVPLLLLNTRKIYTFLWIESIVYRSNSNAMSSINVYVWLFLWFFFVPLSGRNRVSMLFRKKAKTCKLKFTVTEQKPFLPSNIGAEDTELVFVVFHG